MNAETLSLAICLIGLLLSLAPLFTTKVPVPLIRVGQIMFAVGLGAYLFKLK